MSETDDRYHRFIESFGDALRREGFTVLEVVDEDEALWFKIEKVGLKIRYAITVESVERIRSLDVLVARAVKEVCDIDRRR